MKKILLLLCLSLFLQKGKSQVITQSDFPFLGDIWVEYIDTVPSGFSISPSGFSQVWDFSTLYNVNDTGGFIFNPPSAVPNNWDQYFPQAHYSFFLQDTDSTCLFFKNLANGFYIDGVANNNDSLTPNGLNYLDYAPDFMLFPAPFQYGDTVIHQAKFILNDTVSGFPVMFSLTLQQEFYGEGSGSLTTPLWNYPTVLRIKTFTTTYDSTFIDFNDGNGYILTSNNGPSDTSISYQFVKDGPWMLIATLEVDPFSGDVSKASYYESYLISSLNGEQQTKLNVFPNPVEANSIIKFTSSESGLLNIYDSNGKLVLNALLKAGDNLFSTEEFAAGLYHYKLIGTSNLTNNGKFVVTK